MSTILIVDGDPGEREALAGLFTGDSEISVLTAEDVVTALKMLDGNAVHLLISDPGLRGSSGTPLVAQVEQFFPELPHVVLVDEQALPQWTGKDDGVEVITRPWDPEALRSTVRDRLVVQSLDPEQTALVRFGKVSVADLTRARRIQQKLHQDRSLGEVLVELGKLSAEDHERTVRMRRAQLSLSDLLVEDGLLAGDSLACYQQARRDDPGASDRDLLVGQRLVTEDQFLRAQCTRAHIRYVEPDVGAVDSELLERTSFRYMQRHLFLPMHVEDRRLQIVMFDPFDTELIAELERLFGMRIEPCCCARTKLEESLQILERLRGEGSSDASLSLQYREIEETEGDETGEEAVQIVDYLLTRAIQLGASDLHIEPMKARIRVRVRIDGVLQQLTDLPIDFAPRVVSRVKILAGADIAEKRLHQDGKISVKVDGSEVDIRVSSYVTVFGETIVMRLLDRNKGIVPLEKIGFTPSAFSALTEVVLESSSGLVLLVGPTGSGKTTTLYSFIDHANDPSEKVITAEDPVEYVIDGLIQCSVNQKTGPTFPDSLRAIVRQDPDTIVVGEIRDSITASLALESALTGHKVFSTFHTEEAVGAFVRFLEMGAEAFLVASTVSAVVAQRLVRRLCTKCRKPGEPPASELRFLGIDRSELRGSRLWNAGGCQDCQDTGFHGRIAIHEVLLPDDEFRDAVLQRSSSKELRKMARKLPEFLTMQEDGMLKALDGLTTPGEIVANAPRDTSPRPLATIKSIAKTGRTR